MKKLTLLLALIMMGAFTYAFSQEAPPPPPPGGPPQATMRQPQPKKTPEERATDQTTHLQKALLLEKDQYDKVYAINMDIMKQRESQKIKGNKEANMALNQKLEADRQSRIMEVLQPAQKEKYQKMLDTEKARMQQRMQQKEGNTPPPPPAGDNQGAH